jgi:hypothetical protein
MMYGPMSGFSQEGIIEEAQPSCKGKNIKYIAREKRLIGKFEDFETHFRIK